MKGYVKFNPPQQQQNGMLPSQMPPQKMTPKKGNPNLFERAIRFGQGRAKEYETVEDLQAAIIEYFQYCIDEEQLPNRAGLSLFLCCDDDTISEYSKPNHPYSDTIKLTERQIEQWWLQNLGGKVQAAGTIFYLKNKFNYRDVIENPGAQNVTFILAPEVAAKNGMIKAESREAPEPRSIVEGAIAHLPIHDVQNPTDGPSPDAPASVQ